MLVAAEADATRAQADLKRYQVVESRAVSQSQIDMATAQAQTTAAQVDVAKGKEQAAEAQAGLDVIDIENCHSRCRGKNEALHAPGAELDLLMLRSSLPKMVA